MAYIIDRSLRLGASYVDVRVIDEEQEVIKAKNNVIEAISLNETHGFGVRVIADGSWGFSSSYNVDRAEADKVVTEAVKTAKASATARKREVKLTDEKSYESTYETPLRKDPFKVDLREKVELLLEATRRSLSQSDRVKTAKSMYSSTKTEKYFMNSEGSFIQQRITWCGGGVLAMAVDTGEIQTRSYPGSFDGDFSQSGFEFFEELNLLEGAEKVGLEANKLIYAKTCPVKRTNLVLGSQQLALQIHESIGHPSELDRVLGFEQSYAGTSFLTVDKLGRFRVGSEAVNIVADSTIPGGLGTFGFDDEGVKAQKTYLVKEGLLVGYLTSRETATEINLDHSNGAMRADGWNRIPLIRMTNINLEPGDWELDELISDTKEGVYMETNRSWSIDDKRLNFQFGTEVAYEIRNGELGEMLKNVVYSGITYEFWGSCDAITKRRYWRLWGLPNCGKGEPPQVMHVGHGASPARFRNVMVRGI